MLKTTLPETAELILPLSEENPCGEDLSFSIEFDEIQEARREDDPSLDQGEWVTSIKEADWKISANICQNLLKNRTKDLRLASWLTEALSKTSGISGMSRGLEILCALSETYWDQLHPLPEEGDQEQRIGNMSWLITRGVQLIRDFPVVNSKGQTYSFGDLESARILQSLIDRNQDLPDGHTSKASLQQIREAQRGTPRAYYETLINDCQSAQRALAALASHMDSRLGLDGPSFTPLRTAVEAYTDEITRIASELGVKASASLESASAEPGKPSSIELTQEIAPTAGGAIRTRDQALRQLRDVAEYFRTTEPHSPVAYLAEKAARWGEMPLHVWLKAVLKEDGALARFEDLLDFESSDGN